MSKVQKVTFLTFFWLFWGVSKFLSKNAIFWGTQKKVEILTFFWKKMSKKRQILKFRSKKSNFRFFCQNWTVRILLKNRPFFRGLLGFRQNWKSGGYILYSTFFGMKSRTPPLQNLSLLERGTSRRDNGRLGKNVKKQGKTWHKWNGLFSEKKGTFLGSCGHLSGPKSTRFSLDSLSKLTTGKFPHKTR
jgi:hypothetical protein